MKYVHYMHVQCVYYVYIVCCMMTCVCVYEVVLFLDMK